MDFEVWFFLWWGCAWSEISNFCLSDFGLIRGKKFFTNPKLYGSSPALSESILTTQDRKTSIFRFFNENYSFFNRFWRDPEGSPCARNFFQQQVEQNRPIWGAHQKSGNIWPPKSSIPKSSFVNYFQSFLNLLFLLDLGYPPNPRRGPFFGNFWHTVNSPPKDVRWKLFLRGTLS